MNSLYIVGLKYALPLPVMAVFSLCDNITIIWAVHPTPAGMHLYYDIISENNVDHDDVTANILLNVLTHEKIYGLFGTPPIICYEHEKKISSSQCYDLDFRFRLAPCVTIIQEIRYDKLENGIH